MELAGSALAAPFAGYGEVELYPSLADKAAIYASRIMRNHPLPDGNKRTAYDVMVEFVERNGGTFTHAPEGLMATHEMIERVAAQTAATLELIARAENKTVTDTVRTAIDEHIEARRKDKAFMDRLKKRHERERELFERLAQ